MNIKRILALLLALLLTMSAFAFAETAEESTTEETTGTREYTDEGTTYQVITDPVIIKFGDREVHVSEAYTRFMDYYQTLAGYESYGINVANYLDYIKQTVLAEMTQELIEEHKAAELGYNQFTEEELAEIDAQVESTYNDVYQYYYDYFTYNSEPGTDIDATVKEYLDHYNYSREDIDSMIKGSYAANKMATDLTKDITVSAEALQAYYEAAVAEDEEAYYLQYSEYDTARTHGTDTAICWNPEGYRRVLQVLIAFDEDTKAEYASLQADLDKLLAGETLEGTEDEPAMTIEEINARMDELEAPLMETANTVTEQFNNGATIEDLIGQYNDDEGLPAEGYYVNAQSGLWDEAFIDAAFSVTEIGQLSAPYAGQHGLYMVYYLADVPSGAVSLDEVRDVLEPACLTQMKREAYFELLDQWTTELGIETYIDMFITGYER